MTYGEPDAINAIKYPAHTTKRRSQIGKSGEWKERKKKKKN